MADLKIPVASALASVAEIDHPYRVNHPVSPPEANRYCRRLAQSHYENFLVAGVFCPRDLRQDFYNVYSYCRISDDLSDEIGDAGKSLLLLDWWEEELIQLYNGTPRHPVFVALSSTVQKFGIPITPFRNLLIAFRQDQRTQRYETYSDLIGYCENSANPVGRLVLYLCGYSDDERQRLSDQTCTALQLANFWQDVTRDLEKNRIYIPLEDLKGFGYTEQLLFERRFTPQFADLMRFEVERTRALFADGLRLCPLVNKRVRLDIEMFSRGGLEVLRRIEKQQYDVLSSRPAVPKRRQIAMLLGRLVAGMVTIR